ncbi:amino acid adenylation domain-containing protein [Actinosynnema sp. NPDC020468]|uniref:non-ribosomal peptide synthetase n=1 Tax=Actinosynnema sp. NPDC020468 TaxID=3154488 RepID=UPI00340BA599
MTEHPVSPGQEQLWFFDQLVPGSTFHSVPVHVTVRGPLDRDALVAALTAVVRRHEPLRTVYESREDGLVARVLPATLSITVHDLAGAGEVVRPADFSALPDRAAEVLADEVARPLDLAVSPLRVILLRLSELEHRLVLLIHHIAVDGESVPVLQEEILAGYAAAVEGREPEFAAAPTPYRALPHPSAGGEVRALAADLVDLPDPAELPGARARTGDHRSETVPLVVPADLADAVRGWAREQRSSAFMVLLTAFSLLVHRLTGNRDLVVGTPWAGREAAEAQGVVGYFVNMLPLRVTLGFDPTAREAMGDVRDAVLTALDRRHVPFHALVREFTTGRDLASHPIFQLVFACPPPLAPAGSAGGCEFGFAQGTSGEGLYDLEVQLPDGGEGPLTGWVRYRTALRDRADVLDLLDRFLVVLRQITTEPDARQSNRSLLPDAERERLTRVLNDNATDYPAHASLVTLFEQVVDERPDEPALEYGDVVLTYRELDERANGLARLLPAEPVGVFLGRGPDWVVAVLAVLKAGGAYLPLDLDYPVDRLTALCADAGARVVVSDREPGLPGVDVVRVGVPAVADRPGRAVDPNDLAYVMYTSGSTGRPKGVCVTHRNVSRLVLDTGYVVFTAGDRVAQASTTTFDAATFEVWGALLNGGTLVGLPKEVVLDGPALEKWLRGNGIDVLLLTTSLAMHVAREAPRALDGLRYFVFGGEQPDATAIAALAARPDGPAHIVNGYGPTETTTFASSHRCAGADVKVPLGRPVDNSAMYVVDAYLEPVPQGVAGELVIGGDGVARGYVGAPAATAEKFVPDHLGGPPGARLYRTGDLARLRSDGTFEFLGRLDRQVKIRGFRIEPGEVEAALLATRLVREAVVVPKQDAAGDTRLVGYVVPADGALVDAVDAALREALPDYLVPSALVPLESFPLTRNGKLDLRALPEPVAESGADAEPRTAVERALAGVWRAVLGAERVGRDADFFDLGGHSLKATRLVSRVAHEMGVAVPLRSLFDHPTLADFATEVERLRAASGAGPDAIPARTRPAAADLLDLDA